MQVPHDALIKDLFNSRCAAPFELLGWQRVSSGNGMLLRIWRPDAQSISVIEEPSGIIPGEAGQIGPGLFEMHFPNRQSAFPYRLKITNAQRHEFEINDPYLFSTCCFHSVDMQSHRLYEYMGARLQTVEFNRQKYQGVTFRVYAPNARSVSVIGSFNHWDARFHPMNVNEDGIWELFIPGVQAGELYKFEIRDKQNQLLPHKADPFGLFAEQPPGNASIIYDPDTYQWQDKNWKSHPGLERAVSIYEVHPGSWRRREGRWLTYRELAEQLIPYVREMGFTHIEFLPMHEHPFTGSWGYQPVGLFAPTSRYGDPDGFKLFVDRCHQAGIGVIVDWVPAHFPADAHGLERFDGSCLYEYEDPKRGWHPDWQTHIYDYGKSEVRNFLISNALFWFKEYRVDGLRVDAVASMLYLDYSRADGEWEPNCLGGNEHLEALQFLKELNDAVYFNYPDKMMIAEDSSSWPGVSRPTYDNGLGFSYKWNMGWMHDSLEYMKRFPEHRCYHHDQMMHSMTYFYGEHFILPLSHDEVVHMKGTLLSRMPGDEWQKYANLRAYYSFMFGHPGKKLLFMGAEIGSTREWDHDDQLDWPLLEENAYCRGLQLMVKALNHFYQSHPALWHSDYDQSGFQWLIQDDWQQSVYAFYRQSGDTSPIIIISNLTPVIRENYPIGVPLAGNWVETFNSDAVCYGGGGVINSSPLSSESHPIHRQNHSITVTLPPLATIFLVLTDSGLST